jgi:predicted nucleotide-binding protein
MAPLDRLGECAAKFHGSWSGSNLGFHSRIYYENFKTPPPGAHFSSEWGLMGVFQGTTGDWKEYDRDQVLEKIRASAGWPDMTEAEAAAATARSLFDESKAHVVSILSSFLQFNENQYAADLLDQIQKLRVRTEAQWVQLLLSKFAGKQVMSRDGVALMQGFHLAPHEEIEAQIAAVRDPFDKCATLAKYARRAADHIDRLSQPTAALGQGRQRGTQIFIGHGRSLLWRELKDFISDRLTLPYDEFNRVPIAGTTNVDRLSQMLDSAAVAFLILTGEDEKADGSVVARQNVVHEAGLFQGRLGFSRAIIMLEEGCDPFSNIDGLGQIRFPRGNISACFEEVRLVLEREGLLP